MLQRDAIQLFPTPLACSSRTPLPAKISAFSSAVSAACFTDSMVGTIDSVGPLSDPHRMRSTTNTFAASAKLRGPPPLGPERRDAPDSFVSRFAPRSGWPDEAHIRPL